MDNVWRVTSLCIGMYRFKKLSVEGFFWMSVGVQKYSCVFGGFEWYIDLLRYVE